MVESPMLVVTIVIKLYIKNICSFFFRTTLFPSLLWFAFLLPYDNRNTPPGEQPYSMISGVLRETMVIRNSLWSSVSTHLSGKTKTSSHTTHGGRYNVIQIRIRGSIQFKRSKTNIIQRFIVERKHFIGGLNQLVNG